MYHHVLKTLFRDKIWCTGLHITLARITGSDFTKNLEIINTKSESAERARTSDSKPNFVM